MSAQILLTRRPQDSIEECFQNPAYYFFVAKDDGNNVVGYIATYIVRDEAFVENVCVTESARRQGIGRALVERAIENSSRVGDVVLDLFLGSGSTLIACERTGRVCYGAEIDAHYGTVVLARWESFTGEKARKVEP